MSNVIKSSAKYIIRPIITNHPLNVSTEDNSRPCLGPRPVVFLYPATLQPQKASVESPVHVDLILWSLSFLLQFQIVEVGENTYEITCGSMGLADEDDRVYAYPQFPPEEYDITYREIHQSFT